MADESRGSKLEVGASSLSHMVADRSTREEAERRRMLRTQTICLFILAVAAVLTLAYVAKLVLVVLFVSILFAFMLAPIVDFLIRLRLPRPVAALMAMLLVASALYGITFFSYSKAVDFWQDFPKYSRNIRELGAKFQRRAEALRKTTENVLPPTPEERRTVFVRQSQTVSEYLASTVGSFTEIGLVVSFIPFLSFFMLSWQNHVRSATVMLFKMEHRNAAYVTLGLISSMIRSFIVGNVVIGFFLSAVSVIVFGLLGMPYFYFIGVISGFLSVIPYLGVVLAMVPPLVAMMGSFSTEKALVIVVTVLASHVFALNVLYPKILGKRMQLNPLAVSIALLFWGWLWGAMGLILAVPITATIKILLDHTEGFEGYGRWLGE